MTKAEFLKQLGASIAKQRLKLKLTQTEVANRCDIERGNLTRIEKGKSNVTAETLLKISEALDVPVSKLFSFQKKVTTKRN
jgi:transcriptional regulator with XRE-family HTH domain